MAGVRHCHYCCALLWSGWAIFEIPEKPSHSRQKIAVSVRFRLKTDSFRFENRHSTVQVWQSSNLAATHRNCSELTKHMKNGYRTWEETSENRCALTESYQSDRTVSRRGHCQLHQNYNSGAWVTQNGWWYAKLHSHRVRWVRSAYHRQQHFKCDQEEAVVHFTPVLSASQYLQVCA